MSGAILSFLGWSFLPDLASNYLHTFYYTLTLRAGEPRPAPGTPRFVKHRRIIQITVIVTYLLYTLYEAHWEIVRAGDFYRALGLPHDVDEKTLQSRFRRLTILYHPDKVADSSDRPAVESYYVQLKLARDTLLDPAKRFAYDRFGPSITQWQHCVTIRDYVLVGLRVTLPYYVSSAIVLVAMGYLGLLTWGTYWRYLTFIALAAFELHTLTSPAFPFADILRPSVTRALAALIPSTSLLSTSEYFQFPPYLPFQTLIFAHKATITFFIALSRLGPLLEQLRLPPGAVPSSGSEEQQCARLAQRIEQLVVAGGAEAGRQLALETVPFKVVDEAGGSMAASGFLGTVGLKAVREAVKDWLVRNTVRSDREVRAAVARVVERRRMEGSGEVGGRPP